MTIRLSNLVFVLFLFGSCLSSPSHSHSNGTDFDEYDGFYEDDKLKPKNETEEEAVDVYDQSQKGGTNVRVHMNKVMFIHTPSALLAAILASTIKDDGFLLQKPGDFDEDFNFNLTQLSNSQPPKPEAQIFVSTILNSTSTNATNPN
ncbi:PREDICTED: uncharacterized protein LOC108565683 [Nicrophorus vespilloides]|uniref:Uncharacterized protein LOC108565683 n=1 Tax=Nicrophorus vespilloides TaxID=110193 RepID=A0ABM1N1P7_NICVS|nr:PREDICTED: uncharacterized protein LOC108565683 [Nicrophorus vespilloides]